MNDILVILAKSVVVAFVAAIAAWLPWGVFSALEDGISFELLPIALLGSYAVGLPIALLCIFMAGKHLRETPAVVFLMANLAAVTLLIASYAIADLFGFIFLGIPSFLAANVFAMMGWFWILRPMRKNAHA